MTQRQLSPEHVKQQAKQTVRQASPWLEPLGRFDYAAKGVVFGLVGVLAAQAAFGAGGEVTDQRGALNRIVEAPSGKLLLGLVTVGLVGFALWCFVQAFMDTENKGSDAKGYATRTGYAGIGVIYVGLALSAIAIIRGTGGGESGSLQQNWTERLLSHPVGRIVVALIGVAVIGGALYQLYMAYVAKFRENLKLHEMSRNEQTWATRSGRLGYTARGIVFTIIGGFLVVAALNTDAGAARGLSGALQTLEAQSYGQWLLGAVAIGLIAYALFCLVEARYRCMVIT